MTQRIITKYTQLKFQKEFLIQFMEVLACFYAQTGDCLLGADLFYRTVHVHGQWPEASDSFRSQSHNEANPLHS